jgi:hypothetical protein
MLTTGASDKFAVKNIFDVAGNYWELTMESYDAKEKVTRGGSYYKGYGDFRYPASYRNHVSTYSAVGDTSFRVALYITE